MTNTDRKSLFGSNYTAEFFGNKRNHVKNAEATALKKKKAGSKKDESLHLESIWKDPKDKVTTKEINLCNKLKQ